MHLGTVRSSYFRIWPKITDRTVQKSSLRESERMTMFCEKRKQSNLYHTTDNNLWCETHKNKKKLHFLQNWKSFLCLSRGGMVTFTIIYFLEIKKTHFPSAFSVLSRAEWGLVTRHPWLSVSTTLPASDWSSGRHTGLWLVSAGSRLGRCEDNIPQTAGSRHRPYRSSQAGHTASNIGCRDGKKILLKIGLSNDSRCKSERLVVWIFGPRLLSWYHLWFVFMRF